MGKWKRRAKALELLNSSLTQSNADMWRELQEWRNGWRSPERFCSGRGVHGQYITLWGTGFGRVTPCATMTGCRRKAWPWRFCQPQLSDSVDTHPCEVLS
ncbi:MAG: hypothetical protein WC565_03950 [Parcubacteria group bacterium]|jgi:hypothetical protein